MLTLSAWDGGLLGDVGGVGGWNETWLGEGQGGGLGDGDGRWLANVRALGDGDDSGLWAVGGVTSDGDVGGDHGLVGAWSSRGGVVGVGSESGGSQSGQGSESGELHC